MKRLFFFVIVSTVSLSCSKKSEMKKTCYECTQLIEVKRNENLMSFDTQTTTRCDVDQNKIASETKEKTYVQQKDGITTTSTFNCKNKEK